MSNRGTIVENDVAYQRAIMRNIRANAAKTREAKMLASTEGRRCYDFLMELGEYMPTYGADGWKTSSHPTVNASFGDFYTKMRDSLQEWGGLSDAQTKAVLSLIERGETRAAERAKSRADSLAKDAETSGWVGAVGDRMQFDLTLRMVLTMSGMYGTSYLHVMHDSAGNVVVYKGTNKLGDKGDTVSVKATIKEHGTRDGVKQTKISRPKEA
jgi:hypothetical protein